MRESRNYNRLTNLLKYIIIIWKMYEFDLFDIFCIWGLHMNVPYDYYKTFYYVALYRSFTKAAEIMLANQPNVTRTIKNLEALLGCRLFVRSNRSVSITPEGEKLFAHVSVAVEQLRCGENEIESDRGLNSGTVKIGAGDTTLHGILLPVLNGFRKKYPNVKIQLTNKPTQKNVKAVKNGMVDFAFVTTPTGSLEGLNAYRLQSYREIAVAGFEFSHLRGKKVNLSELSKLPLISLWRETKTYELYSHFFMKHGVTFVPDTEAATIDQLVPLVKNNLGIAFVPEFIARDAIDEGGVFEVELDEPFPERYMCMIQRNDDSLSIAAKKFREIVTEGKFSEMN